MSKFAILLWSFLCLILGLWRWTLTNKHFEKFGFPDWLSIFLMMFGAVLMDIYRLDPSKTHTFKTMMTQYLLYKFSGAVGLFMLFRLNRLSRNCKGQQELILQSIFKENTYTRVFNDFKITNVHNVEDYIKRVPLTRFDDYRKYSDLINQTGSTDIMFPGQTRFFAMTSGTTSGKSKMYPKNLKLYKSKILPWFTLLFYKMLRIGNNGKLKKWFEVKIHPKIVTNTHGIRCGPISAGFEQRMNFSLTPYNEIHSEPEALYINLVFGLAEEDFSYFGAIASPIVLSLFKVLEANWESLCEDIELGRISPTLNIEENERIALNKHLHAYPKRALFLRKEFKMGFKNIVTRLWPSCSCILATKTGSFQTQASIVEDKYLGDLKTVGFLHVGTETVYGMNLDPESRNVNYVPLTALNFFEFIPEDITDQENPQTFLAHQVTVGECYEVVITTFEGLYRYRTEDVVQITGFYGTIPKYRFIRRVGDILSTDLEKVAESLLYDSVYTAIKQTTLNTSDIAEFTSVENQHLERIRGTLDRSKCYVIFMEFDEGCVCSDDISMKVDEELSKRHPVYSAMRHNQKIQHVQIKPVMHGTFVNVKKMILNSNPNASCVQYKLPRIMRREDVLMFLLEMNKKQISMSK